MISIGIDSLELPNSMGAKVASTEISRRHNWHQGRARDRFAQVDRSDPVHGLDRLPEARRLSLQRECVLRARSTGGGRQRLGRQSCPEMLDNESTPRHGPFHYHYAILQMIA